MEYEVIVLDFDGVIVESDNIKHKAFAEIFKDYPEYYEVMMKYHFSHNHLSRQDKFNYFFKNILKQPYSTQDIKEMVLRFSELTIDRIIHCPYVNGAVEFLDCFCKRIPLFIASATPLDELNFIIKARGLASYFKGIYGAPMKKIEMFKDIVKNEKLSPEKLLFVGDSREDSDVAQEAKVSFIARINQNKLERKDILKFRNLGEIKDYLLKYAHIALKGN